MSDAIRFYFSFRSPYAWLAAEKLDRELGSLGVPIELCPIFPTPETFPNDPTNDEDKMRHLVQDVVRLAREEGLRVTFPSADDPDWALSHAAALGVDRERLGGEGGARRFVVEVFRRRFAEGRDLGDEQVVADAATAADLDPDAVLALGRSDALRREVSGAWVRAREEDHVFGVPSFVYAGKLYWGQDRMRFVRNAVERKSGSARP